MITVITMIIRITVTIYSSHPNIQLNKYMLMIVKGKTATEVT